MGTMWVETVGVEATGAIDDVNTVYFVSKAYLRGSMYALPNGRMGLPAGHGTPEAIEANPDTGEVHTSFAMQTGDTLHFMFRDQLQDELPLVGEIPTPGVLEGAFAVLSATTLEGELPEVAVLTAEIPTPTALNGELSEVTALAGEWP
jgi:hypothetical protein